MSKMFSVVTLDASHSLMTEHFVPGSPDGLDELLDCDEISEVLAEWPLGDTIEAKIQTYLYGDGETVRADEEDLAFFREHFDHPASLEEAMWIISWQYLTLLVNDDNRLWHFCKLLHIISHHGYTRWQWVLLALWKMLILQCLVVLIPLKLTAPDTTEVAVNLAIIILEHARVDAV